jgi:hypothetical protein
LSILLQHESLDVSFVSVVKNTWKSPVMLSTSAAFTMAGIAARGRIQDSSRERRHITATLFWDTRFVTQRQEALLKGLNQLGQAEDAAIVQSMIDIHGFHFDMSSWVPRSIDSGPVKILTLINGVYFSRATVSCLYGPT